MYYIFVDFDGVLASNRISFANTHHADSYPIWSKLDPTVMEFFNKIHIKYKDVRFVWTTTWRNGMSNEQHTLHWAYSMWYSAGFKGLFANEWRVNSVDDARMYGDRALEIKEYLEGPGMDYKDYIIIDDSDYGFNRVLGKKRFVKTSSEDGMLFSHMLNIWSMTGEWEKK